MVYLNEKSVTKAANEAVALVREATAGAAGYYEASDRGGCRFSAADILALSRAAAALVQVARQEES